MKLLQLMLYICLPLATVHAQAVSSIDKTRSPTRNQDGQAQLQLTTSIVEQKYHSSDFVGFKLRLTFKNIGSVPIILDKRSFHVRRMVSRNLEAAAAKEYETEGVADLFGEGDYFNVDPSDMSNFIVLKPREAYAFDYGVGSFWIDESTPPRKGYLNPGTHFLQIKVITWTYFADPKLFHKKWRNKGFLWSQGITSLPMPFTVEKKEKPQNQD